MKIHPGALVLVVLFSAFLGGLSVLLSADWQQIELDRKELKARRHVSEVLVSGNARRWCKLMEENDLWEVPSEDRDQTRVPAEH